MIKSEELFTLIKSLTRSEKRYFKLHCKQKEDANFLNLFDAIDKQDVYNEAQIKKQFKGEVFLKQLHVTKNYLRIQILDSLRGFHKQLSKDATLKELLRNIEILFHKELYQICNVEIEKAERLARRYELTLGLVEVINWKRKLKQALHPNDFPTFITLAKEQEKLIHTVKETNAYWQKMVLSTWKMIGANYAPDKYKVGKLTATPTTLEGKVLQHNIKYVDFVVNRKEKEALKELYGLISLLEKSPHRIQEDPSAYVSTINNLASYLVFQKKDKEVLELLEKAKSVYNTLKIKTENKSLLKQILRTYNLELELYRNNMSTSNFSLEFISSTERFVDENKNKMPKDYLLSLWFQLAHIRFVYGDYDNALKWLNNILNSKFGAIRLDLQTQARMLNLVVHFEQKNFFVLRYFVDSTKRFMKKSREIKPFENILLRFFTKLSVAPHYEYHTIFKDVYKTLFPKDGEEVIPNDILDYIDYKKWMEANIKKKV